VNGFKTLEMAYSDAETLFQMAEEEKDESLMKVAGDMMRLPRNLKKQN
jgi:hypothetical protein